MRILYGCFVAFTTSCTLGGDEPDGQTGSGSMSSSGSGSTETGVDGGSATGHTDTDGSGTAGVEDDSDGSADSTDSGGTEPLDLDALQDWTRHDGPVLYDEDPFGYAVAADIQVFEDEQGQLRAVYTGPNPNDDFATIKFAVAESASVWAPGPVVLGSEGSPPEQRNKETAFYRRTLAGSHQIYFIGYEDEVEYAAQIFVAEANALEGPYVLREDPVVPSGEQDGHEVYLMTSPSIVEHEGVLYMAYCAWDAPGEQVTAVWVHGATSQDDGQTWTVVGEVDVPVCMEGSFTEGPDGMYYAVSQTDDGTTLSLGRAETPFGEYEMLPEPVLTQAGEPWEVDEINTPMLHFGEDTAYLFYSGANYAVGWWTLLATTSLYP